MQEDEKPLSWDLNINPQQTRLNDSIKVLFEKLNAVVKPQKLGTDKKKVKTKVYKQQVVDFARQFEDWLKSAKEIIQSRSLIWPEVFHYRYQATKQILKSEQLSLYQEMSSLYLAQLKEHKGADTTLRQIAQQMEDFFQTHKQDPDGSIVGMKPDETVSSKFTFYTENMSLDFKGESSPDNIIKNVILWSKYDINNI